MPSFIELFNRQKRDIDKIVDTTFYRLMESEDVINRVMPLRNYTLRELLMMKFNHSKPTIAAIIAEDQEVPIQRARAVLTEELLSQCKIGKAYGFTDKHYEMLKKMEIYLQVAGGQPISAEIERYFFGIAADIPPQIVNRLTVMMFRVLTTGSCNFQDPLTQAQVALTYPDTNATLMPPALTGGALWSAPTTATGLLNLRTLSRNYYQLHGKYPDHLYMRQLNCWELAEQEATKRAYLSMTGATNVQGTDLPALQLDELQTVELIKRWTSIPDVQFFDAVYSEEAANGSITNRYYLEDGWVVMIDDGVVERAFVPTVERDFQPGIYAITEEKSRIPKRESMAGVANGVPAAFDARKLCAQKVSNTTFPTGTLA